MKPLAALTLLRVPEVGVEVLTALTHTRVSYELLESADREYLTCDGERITIHAISGDFTYRITGRDDTLRYYEVELADAPWLSRPPVTLRLSEAQRAHVDKLAAERGVTSAEMARRMRPYGAP